MDKRVPSFLQQSQKRMGISPENVRIITWNYDRPIY